MNELAFTVSKSATILPIANARQADSSVDAEYPQNCLPITLNYLADASAQPARLYFRGSRLRPAR